MPLTPSDRLADRARRYIDAAIAKAERGAYAPTNQNDALNIAAFNFGRMVQAGWISEADAEGRLLQAAERSGYASRDGLPTAWRTIRSGMRKGLTAAEPASLPPELDGVMVEGGPRGMSAEELAAIRERIAAEQARLAAEHDAARAELRRINYDRTIVDALSLRADALEALYKRGIVDLAIEHFGLGWDAWPEEGAPVENYGPPGRLSSLVLPWPALEDPAVVEAYQYRHLSGDGPKIHWHHTLHPGKAFHADAVARPHDRELYIVEGALAAATLWSHGITSTIALPQLRGWKADVAAAVNAAKFERVVFLPDAQGTTVWDAYASTVDKAVIACLPLDPDDLLLEMNGHVDRFMAMIDHAGRALPGEPVPARPRFH